MVLAFSVALENTGCTPYSSGDPLDASGRQTPYTLPERATYLEPFAPLFRRSTSRASLERYRTGLLTDLPRKNCDTIAAAVAGTSTERLQPLVTDATWEPQALDQQRVTALAAQRPAPGIVVLDDTGLPKPGRRSVGVARQYSGTLGKIAKGQVVVSAHYVAAEPARRAPVPWPRTAQLSLPETWATDGARRAQVHVPANPAGSSPRWGAPVVPSGPSSGAPVALSRCRVRAHRDEPDCPFPPQANLTK